jgi:hypothetical protein
MNMNNPILETGVAAGAANLLVNLFKLALPNASAAALVAAALVAGIGMVFVVSLSNGAVLSTAEIATIVLQGIFAAGGAAGLDRISQAAQAKRDEASATPGTIAARRRP